MIITSCGVTIKTVYDGATYDRQYAIHTSGTTAPTTGWSATVPAFQAGKYIWMRERLANADGSYGSWQTPICMTGGKGDTGAAGTSSYTHIRYAYNEAGDGFTSTPNESHEWMGIAVTASATAPTTWAGYPTKVAIKAGDTNLLRFYPWTAGIGSDGGWSGNGDAIENLREIDTDPFGGLSMIWKAINKDAASDGEGGFNSPSVPTDPTKRYRFSMFMKQTSAARNSHYFGCYGYNAAGYRIGVLNLAGTADANAYFLGGGDLPVDGKWYLLVAHIHPSSYDGTVAIAESGVYDLATGRKVSSLGDFKWQSTNAKALIRGYQFYNATEHEDETWFFQPRIDVCEGACPSVAELLRTGQQGATGPAGTPGYIGVNVSGTTIQVKGFDASGNLTASIGYVYYRGFRCTINSASYIPSTAGDGFIVVDTTNPASCSLEFKKLKPQSSGGNDAVMQWVDYNTGAVPSSFLNRAVIGKFSLSAGGVVAAELIDLQSTDELIDNRFMQILSKAEISEVEIWAKAMGCERVFSKIAAIELFCDKIMSNDASITRLQTRTLDLQNGGKLKSVQWKDTDAVAVRKGFMLDGDSGNVDFGSGTWRGNIATGQLESREGDLVDGIPAFTITRTMRQSDVFSRLARTQASGYLDSGANLTTRTSISSPTVFTSFSSGNRVLLASAFGCIYALEESSINCGRTDFVKKISTNGNVTNCSIPSSVASTWTAISIHGFDDCVLISLWTGSTYPLLISTDGTNFSIATTNTGFWIHGMVRDSDMVYCCGSGGKVGSYDLATRVFSAVYQAPVTFALYAIHKDKNGYFWVCGNGNSILVGKSISSLVVEYSGVSFGFGYKTIIESMTGDIYFAGDYLAKRDAKTYALSYGRMQYSSKNISFSGVVKTPYEGMLLSAHTDDYTLLVKLNNDGTSSSMNISPASSCYSLDIAYLGDAVFVVSKSSLSPHTTYITKVQVVDETRAVSQVKIQSFQSGKRLIFDEDVNKTAYVANTTATCDFSVNGQISDKLHILKAMSFDNVDVNIDKNARIYGAVFN